MKIRAGFVSNSSSTSFCVPSFLLTDEQKEMLLSIDDQKETKAKMQEFLGTEGYDWENSKNKYPINEKYHRIYKEMIDNNEWDDSSWETNEIKEYSIITGSTGMWNGTIEKFMEKIGIDPTIIEIINHGHMMVHMATHPEAVKHHIWLYDNAMKRWEALNDKDKEFEIEYGHEPMKETPYRIDDSKFKSLGNTSLQYEEEDYSFVKDKKNED